MLLVLCKSVLRGTKILLFFGPSVYLHLCEASYLLEPMLVTSDLLEFGFSASLDLHL